MGRSGLLRHSAPVARRQNRGASWEEENVAELAYSKEEEWQEEEEWAEEDEQEFADDASQYEALDEDDPSLSLPVDEEGEPYSEHENPTFSEEEQEWQQEADDYSSADERGLVPFQQAQPTTSLIGRRGALITFSPEPGAPTALFITGERQTDKIGALGHAPIAPRAHRPRPFFFHTLAMATVMVSLVISALTVGALSSGPQLWNNFSSLAGFAAPPPPPVPFHWYTVHFTDTVERIAKTFGVKPGGILELNQLVDGEQIYTGMSLKVPADANYGASFHALLKIPYAPAITPPPPYGSYVVPPGFNSFGVQDYAGDPYGGSFGQCTWWAAHKRPDENFYGIGDAWSWADGARARGYVVTANPYPNATVVFQPGVQGALGVGHVAHVEQILTDGWILISEMNFYWNDGGWGRIDYRYITPGPGVAFIH